MNIQSPQLPNGSLHDLAKIYASSYASPHHITFTLAGLRTLFEAFTEGSRRTDQQIVDQTEALAALLAARFQGYQLSEDSVYRRSTHPKAQKCWAAAADIQEMLTSTDVENAVGELNELEVEIKPDAKFKVGDIVTTTDQGWPLRSGSEQYTAAVVVSAEPLVLVSFETDMRWGHFPADKLQVIDTATDEQLSACMRRL